MTSITYDDTIIAGLREELVDAQQNLEQVSQKAAEMIKAAAVWRARSRQWAALLAHAEGREAEHATVTLQRERLDAHKTALLAALDLVDAGLPEVYRWELEGYQGRLKIHLNSSGDEALAALAQWAGLLGAEITNQAVRDHTYHRVDAVHLGAPVQVEAIIWHRSAAESTPIDGTPAAVPSVDPNPAKALPIIEPAAIEAPPLADTIQAFREGVCVNCHGNITDLGGGPVHDVTARPVCHADDPASPYAQFADPFDIGPDPEADPEGTGDEAPASAPRPRAYRVAFDRLGRHKDITPLELAALDDGHLARLIAIDAARLLDTFAEDLSVQIDPADQSGRVLRGRKELGHFTLEELTAP